MGEDKLTCLKLRSAWPAGAVMVLSREQSEHLRFCEDCVNVMLDRQLDCKFRIGLRRFRMLAVARQAVRVLLLVGRGLRRLYQAAGSRQQRNRERGAERQAWTSRDCCHTLSLRCHRTGADYSD